MAFTPSNPTLSQQLLTMKNVPLISKVEKHLTVYVNYLPEMQKDQLSP